MMQVVRPDITEIKSGTLGHTDILKGMSRPSHLSLGTGTLFRDTVRDMSHFVSH
jgi:hypothetical protein